MSKATIDMSKYPGARLRFTDDDRAPDVTVVSYDPATRVVRLRGDDGSVASMPYQMFARAVREGVLEPSASELPGLRGLRLVQGRNAGSVGVLGKGKTIITHAQLLGGVR